MKCNVIREILHYAKPHAGLLSVNTTLLIFIKTLVAILEADKEGFLRSLVSLIQTIVRAAQVRDELKKLEAVLLM